ncbi:DUF899 family protein [Vibrio amylolyticus]|uniref:DUF899 family protein n=1 Tax=Vibrio amylolyticus TaxID=2847292 RepID=UPI00354E69E4
MSTSEIQALERQIFELNSKLIELRKSNSVREEVADYPFETLQGPISLSQLFETKDTLLVIHNMGQGCRYCTLWGDGFNGFIPHLESVMSVVMVSKDTPADQRRFASSRGWHFRMASHSGGQYIQEQSVMEGESNMPGAVVYELIDGKIFRQSSAIFGPGDLYCSMWSLLGLAGMSASDWTPQFSYWKSPGTLDDGGENLPD